MPSWSVSMGAEKQSASPASSRSGIRVPVRVGVLKVRRAVAVRVVDAFVHRADEVVVGIVGRTATHDVGAAVATAVQRRVVTASIEYEQER